MWVNIRLAFERRSIREEFRSLSFATVAQYALQFCWKENKFRIHLEGTLTIGLKCYCRVCIQKWSTCVWFVVHQSSLCLLRKIQIILLL